jgi:hypothetical protein
MIEFVQSFNFGIKNHFFTMQIKKLVMIEYIIKTFIFKVCSAKISENIKSTIKVPPMQFFKMTNISSKFSFLKFGQK